MHFVGHLSRQHEFFDKLKVVADHCIIEVYLRHDFEDVIWHEEHR